MAESKKKKATENKEETKAAPVEIRKKDRPKPEPIYSFGRYFASLGRPAHHAAGMKAFLPARMLRVKRTMEQWKNLFENY